MTTTAAQLTAAQLKAAFDRDNGRLSSTSLPANIFLFGRET